MEPYDSPISINCPDCHSPFEVSSLQSVCKFPDAADAIIDLITGKFNIATCPVCKVAFAAAVPVCFIDHDRKRLATSFVEADMMPKAEEATRALASFEHTRCEDYRKLAVTVMSWVDEFLLEATKTMFSDKNWERVSDLLQLDRSPLVLRVFQLQLAGDLPFLIKTEPPLPEEEAKKYLRKLVESVLVDYLRELYTYSFHHGGIETYLDVIEDRVPKEVILPGVLQQLRDTCEEWSGELLKEPGAFDRAFRAEYINAGAHWAAGAENPRVRKWLMAIILTLQLHKSPAFELPEPFLLNDDVLKRTIPFEVVWNEMVGMMNNLDPEQLRDPEQLKNMLDMFADIFKHCGWEERLNVEWQKGPIKAEIPDTPEMASVICDVLIKTIESHFSKSGQDREAEAGTGAHIVAAMAKQLMETGRRDDAKSVIERILDHAANNWGTEQAGHIALRGAMVMNQFLDANAAHDILDRHYEILSAEWSNLTPFLRMSLLNESGNAYRYLNQGKEAIHEYQKALAIIESMKNSEKHILTLMRNIGIVLREQGRFDEAIAVFESLVPIAEKRPAPDRAELWVSMAKTYGDLNQRDIAREYIDQASELKLLLTSVPMSNMIHVIRAMLYADVDESLCAQELQMALEVARGSYPYYELTCCGVLECGRLCSLPEDLIHSAQKWIEDQLIGESEKFVTNVDVTLVVTLVTWLHHIGEGDKASEYLAAWSRTVSADVKYPWQFYYLDGLASLAVGTSKRWQQFLTALRRIETAVPVAGRGSISTWMSDKEEFQKSLVKELKTAIVGNIATPRECLEVFSFVNAREIGVETGGKGSSTVDDVLSFLSKNANTTLVAFLDFQNEIRCVTFSPSRLDGLISEHSVPRGMIEKVSRRFFSAAPRAIPDGSRHLDDILEGPLTALGDVLYDVSEPGSHICILPSTSMLGLPLHAALYDGCLLLERNPIGLVPNLATIRDVTAESAQSGPPTAGVVVVPKADERKENMAHGAAFVNAVMKTFGAATRRISRLDADKLSVVEFIEGLDWLFLVAHGVNCGRARGRGFCVSDGVHLPPAMLPVDDVPELRRFTVDLVDLQRVETAPRHVVSMACSTGRSIPGKGGVRVGLESALFSSGSHMILAPLWDVDQESALYLLETFVERLARDGMTPSRAHREACLVARERYPDLFRWAPFVLKGKWL